MLPSFETLPRGRDPFYKSRRDAGIAGAQSQRNVPWIDTADDGVTVLNAWRDEMDEHHGTISTILRLREWAAPPQVVAKRDAVIRGLADCNGRAIRVIVVEGGHYGGRSAGTRYDNAALWLVEDTGSKFLLRRGAAVEALLPSLPSNPTEFGHIKPKRREIVSRQIERDPRVAKLTLDRAGNRCEIANCLDAQDFGKPDVHHITPLGQDGADHTDNTVALCPACHARVHRGTDAVKKKFEALVVQIRMNRMQSMSARRR